MKRILMASAFALVAGGQALAADLPPPVAPPPRAPATYIPVAPVYNWTGFYIGGNLGYAWESSPSWTDTAGSLITNTATNSFMGGGQVGVNYQFWGGVVIGAEADFDWMPNAKNTATLVNPVGPTAASLTLNDKWITLATGRLGYAFDRVLVYGKGGGAWVGTTTPGLTFGAAPPFASFSVTNPNTLGWTAGLGVEWAFWGTFSVKAEWDYVALAKQTFTVAGLPAASPFAADAITNNARSINMFSAGVNYKFGPW